MVASHAVQIDACRVREQYEYERQLGDEMYRGVLQIDFCQIESAGSYSESEDYKDHWRGNYGSLKSA